MTTSEERRTRYESWEIEFFRQRRRATLNPLPFSLFLQTSPLEKKKNFFFETKQLRSAVAEAAATVVALEDEFGDWEGAEKGPAPPWAPGARLDFAALAARHPRLAPFLVAGRRKRGRRSAGGGEGGGDEAEGTVTLDFTSHDACAALTSVLLLEGCGVRSWGVPRGSLVPPLGVRDEYLGYVSSLIFSSSSPSPLRPPPSETRRPRPRRLRRRPRILDVGCGSNLVFCLLASSSPSRRWRSIGLDASPRAIADARRLLDSNPHLLPLVELRQAPEEGLEDVERFGILRHGFSREEREAGGEERGQEGGGEEKNNSSSGGGGKGGDEEKPGPDRNNDGQSPNTFDEEEEEEWFDATVCNPPFFSSAAERAETASRFAAGAWGGTDAEVVCPAGGEAAFVSKMIRESCERDFAVGRRVGWFTVFLGKKATLRAMVGLLRGESDTAGGIGGGEGEKEAASTAAAATAAAAAAATAATTATARLPALRLGTSRRPALRWKALDEHGGRTTRWVLAWSWTQQQ